MNQRATRGTIGLAVLLGALLLPVGGAGASCTGPQLQVSPTTLVAGEPADVRGEWFVHGCDDVGSPSTWGCAAEPEEKVRPMRGVRLVLEQGDRRWELGTADAGTTGSARSGRVHWSVRLPADARPGPAELVAGDSRLAVTLERP